MRTTFGQVRQSMLPRNVGACAGDIPTITAFVNRAQDQLIMAGGESGWWGGWQKVVFNVCRQNPYITLPREFARAINLDVCRTPIRIQNEFYEFLEAGPGLQDFYHHNQKTNWKCANWCGALSGYERGVWPSMVDLSPVNQKLVVVATDPRDIQSSRRILVGPCQDQNGNAIYSQDGLNPVNGFYMTLASPMTVSPMIVSSFSGIQKDITYGDVLLYQQDVTTGAQVLLSRYAPDEITPAYRRYYINRLPCGCAENPTAQSPCITPVPTIRHVQVTAMVRLEHIPVSKDTDFMVIGNIPALIEEVKAIKYADQEAEKSPVFEQKSHANAIRLLNEELTKYLGRQQPAVNFAPWGTAKLIRRMNTVRYG